MAKIPDKAAFWGIDTPAAVLLMAITAYWNGLDLGPEGERINIGENYDVRVEELFRLYGWDRDWQYVESAYERMLDAGLLQEEVVCRRKIDWAPTQEGQKAIRESLEPWVESISPEWADDDTVLVGEPTESVTHRKGVEAAANAFDEVDRAFEKLEYDWTYYPIDQQGRNMHDLWVTATARPKPVGVEVITESNNPGHLIQKWERYNEMPGHTLWVFDHRKTAVKMFNELDARGLLSLDGQMQDPGNWAAESINRKIWRCSSEPQDAVQTVTGLLEGQGQTLFDLLCEYNKYIK